MASIVDIRRVDAPQRAYEFEVEVLGPTALPVITQRVQNVSVPEQSHDIIELNYKSSKTIHAGRDASPHTVTVTFFDDESRSVYNLFKAWMDLIRNPINGAGVNRSVYQGAMTIKTFAHDETTVTGTDQLTVVFPTSLGEVTLSYDTSDVFTFDVTFSFDERITIPA